MISSHSDKCMTRTNCNSLLNEQTKEWCFVLITLFFKQLFAPFAFGSVKNLYHNAVVYNSAWQGRQTPWGIAIPEVLQHMHTPNRYITIIWYVTSDLGILLQRVVDVHFETLAVVHPDDVMPTVVSHLRRRNNNVSKYKHTYVIFGNLVIWFINFACTLRLQLCY